MEEFNVTDLPLTSQLKDAETTLEFTRSNLDGTFYQSRAEADVQIRRRHFFSPLSHTLADAVNRDADMVEYTAEEEVRTFKCQY